MYRSVPADIKEGSFRNGDWITPSKSYAEDNAAVTVEIQQPDGEEVPT